MAMLTVPQSNAYGVLKAASNFKTIIDGLRAILPLAEIAGDAQHLALEIENAIDKGELPSREHIDGAWATVQIFEDAVQRVQTGLDRAFMAAELLLGRQMVERNGDTVLAEDASADAVSECIYESAVA